MFVPFKNLYLSHFLTLLVHIVSGGEFSSLFITVKWNQKSNSSIIYDIFSVQKSANLFPTFGHLEFPERLSCQHNYLKLFFNFNWWLFYLSNVMILLVVICIFKFFKTWNKVSSLYPSSITFTSLCIDTLLKRCFH